MKKSMGKPYAGKLHVRFEEGAGRGESSLPLYSTGRLNGMGHLKPFDFRITINDL